MRRTANWLLLALTPALLGCISTSPVELAHQPGPARSGGPRAGRLALPDMQEGRPGGAASDIALGMLVFIPLVPYGPQEFKPEGFLGEGYSMPVDLTKALGKDLRASGLFEEVAVGAGEGDLVLRTKLLQGVWRRNFTCYGLSLGGPALWLLGLPTSYGSVELSIEAQLLDGGGGTIASQSFTRSEYVFENLYVGVQNGLEEYAICFAQIAPELRGWLESSLVQYEAVHGRPARSPRPEEPPAVRTPVVGADAPAPAGEPAANEEPPAPETAPAPPPPPPAAKAGSCDYCGQKLPAGATKCPHCGYQR